jgi:hypothetical protein
MHSGWAKDTRLIRKTGNLTYNWLGRLGWRGKWVFVEGDSYECGITACFGVEVRFVVRFELRNPSKIWRRQFKRLRENSILMGPPPSVKSWCRTIRGSHWGPNCINIDGDDGTAWGDELITMDIVRRGHDNAAVAANEMFRRRSGRNVRCEDAGIEGEIDSSESMRQYEKRYTD